tara:strand:+ start:1952 stop:2740 length:789 start_codon:yes stop_codon:yes gene_type:complete
MKITIFTANQLRHNFFVNLLSEISDEIYVVQENRTVFPGKVSGYYNVSKFADNYFSKVINAEKKIFGDSFLNFNKKKIKILPLSFGDLNKYNLEDLKHFLKSDIYIVFGSSYIKGKLVNFLIKKKAINIHMGVSPYYRGTDCNFWALYDGNSHLVGATIQYLSKGLDNGDILYHALSSKGSDPFLYSMLSVKSAFYSLIKRIKNKSIFKLKCIKNNNLNEIRYSRKNEFNDKVIKNFFKKKIKINKNFDLSLLKDPFFLNKN